MKYDRIEIRLDEEHQRKIAELKAAYGTSASEILRRGIDAMYEEKAKERRKKALETLLAIQLDDTVPEDMAALKRQLGRHPDYLQDDVADPD